MTIVHGHLLKGRRHADCKDGRCATGCELLALDEWLLGPVTKSDRAADERRDERLQALMRGNISA